MELQEQNDVESGGRNGGLKGREGDPFAGVARGLRVVFLGSGF